MRRPVRIDKEELDALAGVTFEWSDVAELVDLVSTYVERFGGPPLADYLLDHSWERHSQPSRMELEGRRAFVEAVEGVWRERCRRTGLGAHYDPDDEIHSGPLVKLLQYLLRAAGEAKPPSAATLAHDVKFLATGRERRRGKPHSRATRK
jgi:hypothetical protein